MRAYAGRRMSVSIYRWYTFEFSLFPAHIFGIQDYKVVYILLRDKILLPPLAGIKRPTAEEDYIRA